MGLPDLVVAVESFEPGADGGSNVAAATVAAVVVAGGGEFAVDAHAQFFGDGGAPVDDGAKDIEGCGFDG